MITGPTIQPYRMEELSLVLGRNTAAHREADIHVSNSANINHVHAKVVFEDGCYNIINVSRRGFQLKTNKGWKEITGHMAKIPLPNPAAMNFQGSFIFLQAFLVKSADTLEEGSSIAPMPKVERKPQEMPPSAATLPNDEEFRPQMVTRGHAQAQKGGKPPAKRNVASMAVVASTHDDKETKQWSYASMIAASIQHHGGEATYKQINEYIGEGFKEVVKDRRTWKNSVGGVLSSSGFFESIKVASDPISKKRGGIWKVSARGEKLVLGHEAKDHKSAAPEGDEREGTQRAAALKAAPYDNSASSDSSESSSSSSGSESESSENGGGANSEDEGPPILAMQ